MLAGQEDDGEGSHDEEDVEEEEEDEAKKGDAILFQKLHGNMTQQVRKDQHLSPFSLLIFSSFLS